jgi:serine/threonine protein kinase
MSESDVPASILSSSPEFVSETVFKRDVFSETHSGHLRGRDNERVIRRIVTASPIWTRPLAWVLARREIRALKAVRGITGTPTLIATDRDGLLRDWLDGAPIQIARPSDREWYRGAHIILRELRKRGVTHNDLAKPQNWLMRADGSAAVIDFQLASVHRWKSPLFRVMAYEDFRHLLKQKRSFAPELLTPTARRILARRSLPSRIWMASGKKLYNLFTRRVLHWSDGEGTHDRIDREGPAIRAAFQADPRVTGFALLTYSLPAKGVGLYAFVETELDEKAVRAIVPASAIELVQPVAALPRRDDGSVREDVLMLVALNQITQIESLLEREPELSSVLRPIVSARRNFTDRRLTQTEL